MPPLNKANKNVEGVKVNLRCSRPKVLQQTKVRLPFFVECYKLTVQNRSVRQAHERIGNVGELLIEHVPVARIESDLASILDHFESKAIELDFLCGAESYVAYGSRSAHRLAGMLEEHNIISTTLLSLVITTGRNSCRRRSQHFGTETLA